MHQGNKLRQETEEADGWYAALFLAAASRPSYLSLHLALVKAACRIIVSPLSRRAVPSATGSASHDLSKSSSCFRKDMDAKKKSYLGEGRII